MTENKTHVMNGRTVRRWAVLALAVALVAPAAAWAQEDAPAGWTVPRTADGHPDLQGVWANNSVIPFERPEEWDGKERLSEEEVAALEAAAKEASSPEADALFGDQLIQAAIAREKAESYDPSTGNYNGFWIVERTVTDRTSLVVDPPNGRLPAMTEKAIARATAARTRATAHPADVPSDRPLSERCISFGAPNLQAGYNSYLQIFQGSDHVAIVQEMIHDARIIPIDGRERPDDDVKQLHGVSRGHWEGDTLVVETTHYTDKSGGYRPTSVGLKVTERFTRVGPETLQQDITYEDPATWTEPWTVSIPLEYSVEPMFEYACHEGNIGMEGILAGHRAEEREAAAGAGGQ